MSLKCPVDLDVMMLRHEVSAMDARVATSPEGEFHFHRGPDYAARKDHA
jgi:arsenite methyltransferase